MIIYKENNFRDDDRTILAHQTKMFHHDTISSKI